MSQNDKPIELHADSLASYLASVDKAGKMLLNGNGDSFVIFRGQPIDADLFPKLGRDEYKVDKREESEKKLIAEFERISCAYLKGEVLSEWDVLALAQHHGLPTRLLDWTSNPLTALWFALWNAPMENFKPIIWCYSFDSKRILNPNKGGPFNQKETLVFQPKHITSRIVSQNAWFTSHYYVESSNMYTALNFKRGGPKHLVRIVLSNIDSQRRENLLDELDRLGIHSASAFPGLDGLCQYLDWKEYKRSK